MHHLLRESPSLVQQQQTFGSQSKAAHRKHPHRQLLQIGHGRAASGSSMVVSTFFGLLKITYNFKDAASPLAVDGHAVDSASNRHAELIHGFAVHLHPARRDNLIRPCAAGGHHYR